MSSIAPGVQAGEREAGPRISVVMAVHGSANIDYLKAAIESIAKQDYGDLELLIIADGPLSHKQALYIDEVVQSDKRFIFHQLDKNVGPGAARNVGILKARGEYLAVMDSDDLSMTNRLGVEMCYLDLHSSVSVVGCACEIIDDNGNTKGIRRLPEKSDELVRYAQYFCPLNNPTVMGRTEILKKYLYDESRRKGEDYNLWVRLLLDGYKIANIKEPLLKYRVGVDLYKRRVGLHKAASDFSNRIQAAQLASWHRRLFVYLFAAFVFLIRLLPHRFNGFLTSVQESVGSKRLG